MSKKNRNLKDYEAHEKKKMSGISKIISTLIVLLLLGGLVFAVFAFVDNSNRVNERLNNQSTEEHKDKKDKDTESDKKNEESTRENTTSENNTNNSKEKTLFFYLFDF